MMVGVLDGLWINNTLSTSLLMSVEKQQTHGTFVMFKHVLGIKGNIDV